MKGNSCLVEIRKSLWLLILNCCALSAADDYTVRISGDSSVVIGGTLHFKAELFDSNMLPARGQFQYEWVDNAIPSHQKTEESELPLSFWNVTYSPQFYAPGPYNIEVNVKEKRWWSYTWITSQRFAVTVSLSLNGELTLSQAGQLRNGAVAVNQPVVHTVALSHADDLYVKKHKNKVISYWFVDCSYVGPIEGLSSSWNYTQVDSKHDVTAIVMASYVSPPPPSTTTTSTTTTTTTPPSTTSTSTTTTPKPTVPPVTTSKPPPFNVSSDTSTVAPAPADPWTLFLASFPRYNASQISVNSSGNCFNMSSVPLSDNSTYGFFQRTLKAKAPVRVKVNGTNWLRDGDMFNMNLTCNGSAPIGYCIKLKHGLYNVTGNETCDDQPLPLPSTSMQFFHLFKEPDQYTYVVIVQNPVSKTVTPVGVNVYKAKKQPQISVIVVPVAFSIVAVILIVSGVAWYVHTRRTFPVEVADFDFGQQSSDLEYKTFRERLRDSVMASFFRTGDSQEPKEGGWSPTRKYGSMP